MNKNTEAHPLVLFRTLERSFCILGVWIVSCKKSSGIRNNIEDSVLFSQGLLKLRYSWAVFFFCQYDVSEAIIIDLTLSSRYKRWVNTGPIENFRSESIYHCSSHWSTHAPLNIESQMVINIYTWMLGVNRSIFHISEVHDRVLIFLLMREIDQSALNRWR